MKTRKCLHCEKDRSPFWRNLCRTCYRTPGVKEQYPDGRCRPVPSDPRQVAERNRLVLALDYSRVYAAAVKVARRFGPRVDASDLAQSAYVRIVRAAERLRCTNHPAGLWECVRVGIGEEMRRVAARATRENLFGHFTDREREQLVKLGLVGECAA